MHGSRRDFTREPITSDFDIGSLNYPHDKFDLLSVDYIKRWTEHRPVQRAGGKVLRDVPCRAVVVTLRCKRCGTIKQVEDKATISCKVGPCNTRWVDLTGRVFGRLTVVRAVKDTAERHSNKYRWHWECLCECGRTCYKNEHDLCSASQVECRSCARKHVGEMIKLPDNMSDWNREYKVAQRNARMRNYSFLLTKEEFIALCKEPCFYCGAEPVMRSSGLVKNGVDRFDNAKGYTKDNSVPCCSMCNTIKLDHPYESLLQHLERMLKHCKERSTTIPQGSTLKRVETDSPEKEDIV